MRACFPTKAAPEAGLAELEVSKFQQRVTKPVSISQEEERPAKVIYSQHTPAPPRDARVKLQCWVQPGQSCGCQPWRGRGRPVVHGRRGHPHRATAGPWGRGGCTSAPPQTATPRPAASPRPRPCSHPRGPSRAGRGGRAGAGPAGARRRGQRGGGGALRSDATRWPQPGPWNVRARSEAASAAESRPRGACAIGGGARGLRPRAPRHAPASDLHKRPGAGAARTAPGKRADGEVVLRPRLPEGPRLGDVLLC